MILTLQPAVLAVENRDLDVIRELLSRTATST